MYFENSRLICVIGKIDMFVAIYCENPNKVCTSCFNQTLVIFPHKLEQYGSNIAQWESY